jgi:hypothetical protein
VDFGRASRIKARVNGAAPWTNSAPPLRRVSKFVDGQRVGASAASVSRFEDGHPLVCAGKLASGHQPRSAGADDQKGVSDAEGSSITTSYYG